MTKHKPMAQQPTWQEQLATVAEAIEAPKQEAGWYSIMPTDMPTDALPLAMPLKDAARLCGVSVSTGFYLINHDWKPFVRRYAPSAVAAHKGLARVARRGWRVARSARLASSALGEAGE